MDEKEYTIKHTLPEETMRRKRPKSIEKTLPLSFRIPKSNWYAFTKAVDVDPIRRSKSDFLNMILESFIDQNIENLTKYYEMFSQALQNSKSSKQK